MSERRPAAGQRFGQLVARELELGIAGPDRLSVHAYMAQHPGLQGRRQAQSVDVHLMVLGAVLERGSSVSEAVAAMAGWMRGKPAWPWLEPPARASGTTIQDVPLGVDRPELESRVRSWAEVVWASWFAHQATVLRWLDQRIAG